MSHDADKLIRQLSLVAFLMAERRLLTARDVKSNVEGYSEMSDEAFARRFYSDRAELTALGVPLQSQRDEFTGEELYTLRSENYFLDRLELDDDELAALQTALYYLEGKFAYAEPLRLALQNLALGRSGFAAPPTETAERVRVSAPDYSPELASRLSKLEAAISKQRTVPFRLLEPEAAAVGRARRQSVRPPARRRQLVRDRARPRARHRPHVQGLPDPRRHPLCDETRARLPGSARLRRRAAPDPAPLADRRDRGHCPDRRHRRHRLVGRTHAGGRGERRGRGLRDGLRAGRPARELGTPPERASSAARARRAARRSGGRALATARGHQGDAPAPAGPKRADSRQPAVERPSGPVAPERFGLLQALLAHLLAACGEEKSAVLDAAELAERFSIPLEELQDNLSLLNLVNFGGGCYAVYSEHDGDVVRVDKELYGDVFRRPPKLTPLEARAIRLAIEYVGPTIAADAHTKLVRVRKKLEETFGRFDLNATPEPRVASDEETLVKVLSDGAEKGRVVELEYLKEGEDKPTLRRVEPYTFERELPVWRVHTWDRTVDGARTFRLDRMRSARLTDERFERREGFDPSYLQNPRVAVLLHSPAVARWKLERGAQLLTDGSAIAHVPYKTEDWLLSEVLADRGETVVLEPQRLRDVVARRARRLQRELLRVPSARS